jgi:hypothetical protein
MEFKGLASSDSIKEFITLSLIEVIETSNKDFQIFIDTIIMVSQIQKNLLICLLILIAIYSIKVCKQEIFQELDQKNRPLVVLYVVLASIIHFPLDLLSIIFIHFIMALTDLTNQSLIFYYPRVNF